MLRGTSEVRTDEQLAEREYVLGMQQLFILVVLVKKVLRIRVRAKHHPSRYDITSRGFHIPRAIVPFLDGVHGRVGEQLAVGEGGGDGFAHEGGAELVPVARVLAVVCGGGGGRTSGQRRRVGVDRRTLD